MNDQWVNDMNQTTFYLEMVLNLSGALERVIGLEDAEGYLSLVGTKIGQDIYDHHRVREGEGDLPIQRLAEILVELKSRIKGEFSVESIEDGKITLVNTTCPFGKGVEGHESLCMMTSNVFGTIASEAFGQANVHIPESIAAGHGRCRVVVSLADANALGRNYFRTS